MRKRRSPEVPIPIIYILFLLRKRQMPVEPGMNKTVVAEIDVK
jgi:hypothetical protein